MKKSIRNTLFIAGGLLSAQMASALTIEQYCDPSICAPEEVKEMRPLADGQCYACISDDEDAIEVYSYKTGKMTSKLFDVKDIKGSVRIDSFDGYALSDDNTKILLWTDKEKIYRHSFTAEYYVYDVKRCTLKKVSDGGPQRGAILSHDGRMVAYQRDNNIFISNLDYGTDIAVTKDGEKNKVINGTSDWGYEEEFGVLNTMRWSKDDAVLAFIRFDETKVPEYNFDIYKSYCEADPETDLYPKAYSYKYPLAGFPNSIVSVHAYIVSDRKIKTMDLPIAETDYIPSMEYAADTHDLMVMILNRDQNHLRLFKVNDASTVGKQILTFSSKAWLAPDVYQTVRYGKNSFIIADDESGWKHLYEYSYEGVKIKAITSGEFNVTQYYGYDDVRKLHYFQATILGAINRNVCSVDAKGNIKILNSEEGTENAAFSAQYDYFLRSYSNAQTPTQYTICNNSGKKTLDVQLNKQYAALYASAPKMKFLKVKNAVGEEMDAFMILPPDFDETKKYPLMMYQYNGPDSQQVLNRWRMEGIFYIASQGYIVATVDGRGTAGRSRAWAHSVYKRLGQLETDDQLAGAAYFASLPYIDSERTSCFGWSYGGYMTLMELSDVKCRFKCGVSMAPVTDWRFYDSIYTERYMLTPQQNEEGYEAASALNRTGEMNKRLLIMSGTSDDNVHFYNTLKYTSKLGYEGKTFDMMALAGFEHSLPMCNARVQLFRKITEYLDSRLK